MSTTVPSLDDVRRLPSYAAEATTVPDDWADENGHMNIGHYFRLASHAVWHRMRDLGMAEDYIATREASFFVVEHRIGYRAELRPGDRFGVRAGLVGQTPRALHAAAFVVDEEHDRVACTLEALLVHVSMRTRRSTPVPDALAAAFAAEIEQHAGWLPAVARGLELRR
ncbi:acyl-CoA thioester hydrolase [Nocardioides scoriae]|uniref:Acyl-CoA thioester hydrolase n=1 Tax=Nocardioides scoriae TaxID=642780 RepID=A0A1H1VBH4_9ACTN|nr:thioesterase family protein [Nocardioides scoriae]SDS81776.1 acyl-CoA thioester hydrolase [Nocardioides scoriae]